MTEDQPSREDGNRARALRKAQAVSEGLLWSVLQARQLCGLKFRRQHPIEPGIVDFACPERMLVVEIDGGYHNNVVEHDLKRQKHLESMGWTVLRFSSDKDAEAVARAIARELHLEYEFSPRMATGSGMSSMKAPKKRCM